MYKRRSKSPTNPLSTAPLKDFLVQLENDEKTGCDIAHHEILGKRPVITGRLDPALPDQLVNALHAIKVERLYSHQVEGIQHARAGHNVVTVTPTASGKTLNYLLPIFERLIEQPDARALLLFPIKALAQDQLKKIQAFIEDADLIGQVSVDIYDGDTPQSRRVKIRKNPPNLLLTNPDMINQGLLPFHTNWQGFFENLQFVVVDELHNYKGVFGSHVLQVLRRLRRICLFHHSKPQFLAASATIANPGELAEMLVGEPFEVVDVNGAPHAERHVLFLNPSGSLYTSAVRLLADSTAAGLKTIVFTKARRMTELIHNWTLQSNPELIGRISAYRSGYLPKERREIEQKLLTGELDGVIATSALEMGIDIGGLDVAVLVGYPGSIASTWQRGGRVGRKDRDSAIFLLAMPDALDQYWMRHPQDFFARSAEAAVVDPTNPFILKPHLVAAAQETPLRAKDPVYPREQVGDQVDELVKEELLLEAVKGQVWFAKDKRPQRGINIRGGGETFGIHEEKTGRLIGKVNSWQALVECHPGAIYLHHGKDYIINHLDLGKREAIAQKTDVPYYTQARSEKDTEILETYDTRETERYKVSFGKLKVTEKVVGYEKRSTAGRDKISDHELDLPPVVYESVGLWFEPPQSAIAGLLQEKRHPMGSLHASEHASLALIPLFALCDRNDLGGISFTRHAGTGGAAVFLYDGHPGGLGLANRAYAVLDELFMRVLKMVRDCPCEDGCPSCVHSPKCGHGNQPLDKEGCIRLLEHLTGGPELKADETLAELTFGTEGNAQTKPLGWPGSERGSHSERSEESRGSAPTENERSLQKTPRMTNEETGDTEMNEAQNSKKYESQTPFCEGRDIVVYDLETQLSANDVGGWQNIHLMRVAIGVIYERKTGKYLVYREEDCEALIARLEQAELVVGYNNKRFDNTVLTAYTDHDLRGMNNLDLLEEISNRHGFRMKLDALAQATLNAKKTADGLQSLQWWKEGEVDKIIEYCKMDVEVTWKLFEYMCEHGYALCERKGELAKLPVELPLKRIMGEPDLFSGLM